MLSPREIVQKALAFRRPPYVPWSMSFTHEAREKLEAHFGVDDLDPVLHNHLLGLGNGIGFFEDIGNDRVRDVFGVVWNRSVDKDIGDVENQAIPEPTLDGYVFPDPHNPRVFADIPEKLATQGDRFRVFNIGFSLFERAWTLRGGLEEFCLDLMENPQFAHDLLRSIADYNLAQVEKALTYDIDAVYFGDDWGQQQGLIMGERLWMEFIYPEVKRMYGRVRAAGKKVFIHSCGDVDGLFDTLVEIGVNVFNPFQPEVMDVQALIPQYHGRLAFHGGISTQRTLPYGTPEEVRAETRRMMELGQNGGYIIAPAHAVEGDVPLENLLAVIETAQDQPGWR